MGEKEGEEERSPRLLSMIHEFFSIGIRRAKNTVHRLDKGYACVPKTRSFTKDPKEQIWENQRFFFSYEVFLRPPTFSSTLQEVGILPTLVLPLLFGLI